jgi:hypothetical protein
VVTSYNTSVAGPSPACAAHARAIRSRHASVAYLASRRLIVGYDAAGTPTSSNTRIDSSLLVGSMILASTSPWNTSSRSQAKSNPNTW